MNKEREQGLYRYIITLRDEEDISADMAKRAWSVWEEIKKAVGENLLVPDASSGPNGEFMFIWNKGKHHLEIELIETGQTEFFYRDRETGVCVDKGWKAGEFKQPFIPEVMSKLQATSAEEEAEG